MTAGELTSRSGLQVLFECPGFLFGAESDYGLNTPRAEIRSVCDVSGIVLIQPALEICGIAGVMARCVCQAGKDVDVVIWGL